jgi:hypothetical protein
VKRNVAILLFDDVEVLDFAGPFEVFSVTDELRGHDAFNVFTVRKTSGRFARATASRSCRTSPARPVRRRMS